MPDSRLGRDCPIYIKTKVSPISDIPLHHQFWAKGVRSTILSALGGYQRIALDSSPDIGPSNFDGCACRSRTAVKGDCAIESMGQRWYIIGVDGDNAHNTCQNHNQDH